jgi:acyl carrier protein/D-alanine--poly(phosphoribitol) ligase subunit 2
MGPLHGKEPEMEEAILEYIRDEYLDDDDEEEIDAGTPLISSGIVDSFSMVSLKRFVEQKYGITIPDEQATPEAFDTVSGIVRLIESHKKGA